MRGGSRRWIDLGVFNLQPSEFAKVAVALVLAKLLRRTPARADHDDLLIAGILTAVPLLLIARQPDLGTAVTLLPVFLAIAYVAGMPMRYLGILSLVALLAAPVAYQFGLQDYQRERIATFLDPEQDPRGAGLPADPGADHGGSGGLWGKGFMGAPRASSASCRWPTTTSSSRCWPRSRGSRASSWRSGFISS